MTRRHFEAIAAELRRQRPDLREVVGVPTYASSPAWDRGAYDEWATICIGLAGTVPGRGARLGDGAGDG